MKLVLKAPGTKRLKLKCDGTAFKLCFQFQLAPLHLGARAVHVDDVAGVQHSDQ